MLRTKRILAAAVALLAAQIAGANVIETMPADTLVAIKVTNLQQTSVKVAKLSKDFGIDQFVPQLQDPLGSLKAKGNITKGLKDDGELGMAILKPTPNAAAAAVDAADDMMGEPRGREDEPGLVVLVPVTNFQDFVNNFQNVKMDGDIAEVVMPNETEPSFIANWGEYAAMSPERARVASKPQQTLKLGGVAAKAAKEQDAIVYANFAEITPSVMPDLEKGIEKALGEIEGEGDIPAKWKPLAKVAFTQLGGVAKTYLRDSESAVIGLTINDAGINASVIAEFKSDSYLGSFAKSLKGTDAPLTVGLPEAKYLLWGGAAYNAEPVAKVVDDLVSPIIAELGKVEGQDEAKQLADQMMAFVRANKGMTFGMPAPTKIGEDAIFQQIAIYDGGGAEARKAVTSGGALINTLMAEIEVPEGQPKPKFTITPNAREIAGVSFDKWTFEPPTDPNNPGAAQMDMMMGIMYGKQGLSYSFGNLPDGNFMVATAASDDMISKFVQAHQNKEDNLSKLEHVKVVTAQLPKTRVYEAYIPLDEWMRTGADAAGMFGMPIPVQLPPDLPPVGVTLSTESSAIRIDTHIPSTTVQALISAGMQVFMQMQGGGGGNL